MLTLPAGGPDDRRPAAVLARSSRGYGGHAERDRAPHGAFWRGVGERVRARPAPRLGRHGRGARRLLPRPAELLRRAHPGQLVPRRRRVDRGAGHDRRGVPGRPERADRRRSCGTRRRSRPVAARWAGSPGVAEVTPTAEPRAARACCSRRSSTDDPYSTDAFALIPELRAAARAADPRGARRRPDRGRGRSPRAPAPSDTRLLVPVAHVIVFVILLLLLRAVAALGAADRHRGPELRGVARRRRRSSTTSSSASPARTRRCRCSPSSSWWRWGSTTTSS